MIKEVIKDCLTCVKAKISRHKPYGELRPLLKLERAWKSVSMDFIAGFPESREPVSRTTYDSILVIVDRLTKYAYFIPHKKDVTAEEMAYAFLRIITS